MPVNAPELGPGYRLEGYEILAPLATGGMAAIWIARRVRAGRSSEKLVVVKTILPQHASDAQFQKMFLDEALISYNINHTNVARVFDLGAENDILYIAMEWVDGEALSTLREGAKKKGVPLPHGVALRIIADACGGAHAAHELKAADGKSLCVVHRDISPDNILVSADGVAKIIDFGIAKARDRLGGDTSTGLIKGKAHYISPEQALAQAVDRRADVWALGATAYHLVAGIPVYDGRSPMLSLQRLASGKPPARLPASVPAPVADVIMRALSYNPDGRFDDAAQMQQALEQAMVATGLTTTTGDVASFLATHFPESAAGRRRVIARALGQPDPDPQPPPTMGEAVAAPAIEAETAPRSLQGVDARRRRLRKGLALVVGASGLLSAVAFALSHRAPVPSSPAPPVIHATDRRAPAPELAAPSSSPSPDVAPAQSAAPPASASPRPAPATPTPAASRSQRKIDDGF